MDSKRNIHLPIEESNINHIQHAKKYYKRINAVMMEDCQL